MEYKHNKNFFVSATVHTYLYMCNGTTFIMSEYIENFTYIATYVFM